MHLAHFKDLLTVSFRKPLIIFALCLGDMLINSSSTLEYLQRIEWVLSKLGSHSLFSKPTKCEFDLTELY